MSEFDVNGYNSHECDIHNHGYYLGEKSQQAKIDCMKVELDGANERAIMMFNHKNVMVDKMQAKIDELQTQYDELNNRATGIALDQMTTAKLNYELQGRIDEALLKLTEKKIMYVDIVAETINILKGNKDEK